MIVKDGGGWCWCHGKRGQIRYPALATIARWSRVTAMPGTAYAGSRVSERRRVWKLGVRDGVGNLACKQLIQLRREILVLMWNGLMPEV